MTEKMTTRSEEFGNRVRAARLNAGLSQRRVCDDIHCSRRTIQAWERGDSASPDPALLFAFAQLTGTTIQYLRTGAYEHGLHIYDALVDRQRLLGINEAVEELRHPPEDGHTTLDLWEIVSKAVTRALFSAGVNPPAGYEIPPDWQRAPR